VVPAVSRLSMCLGALALLSGFAAGSDQWQAMVAVHNALRAEVGVAPLRWSPDLTDGAQRWADHLATEGRCRLVHSGPGENLYWASAIRYSNGHREPQSIGAAQVAQVWAYERSHYDGERHACAPGRVCGHYTQMFCKRTETLGCSYSLCADGGQVWVCRYRPAGNVIGERPF